MPPATATERPGWQGRGCTTAGASSSHPAGFGFAAKLVLAERLLSCQELQGAALSTAAAASAPPEVPTPCATAAPASTRLFPAATQRHRASAFQPYRPQALAPKAPQPFRLSVPDTRTPSPATQLGSSSSRSGFSVAAARAGKRAREQPEAATPTLAPAAGTPLLDSEQPQACLWQQQRQRQQQQQQQLCGRPAKLAKLAELVATQAQHQPAPAPQRPAVGAVTSQATASSALAADRLPGAAICCAPTAAQLAWAEMVYVQHYHTGRPLPPAALAVLRSQLLTRSAQMAQRRRTF